MGEIVFDIPEYFTHDTFDRVLPQIDLTISSGDPSQKVVFDFSKTTYLSTEAVLFVSQTSDRLGSLGYAAYARYGTQKIPSWFMSIMGATAKNLDQQLSQYMDTHRVGIQRCFNARQSLDALNQKLIPLVRNNYNPPEAVLKALNWALWEAIDNAGIHGYGANPEVHSDYPHPVYFCAYAFKDDLDISILDQGQGVRASFASSGVSKYQGISAEQALIYSILKDETSKPGESMGFGLYGCAELARQSGGRLIIISEDRKLVLDQAGQRITPCYTYQGTLVTLQLPRHMTIDLGAIFGHDSAIAGLDLQDLFGDFNG